MCMQGCTPSTPLPHSPTVHTRLLKGRAVVHAHKAPNPHGWLVKAHNECHEHHLVALPCQVLGPHTVVGLQGMEVGWVS